MKGLIRAAIRLLVRLVTRDPAKTVEAVRDVATSVRDEARRRR